MEAHWIYCLMRVRRLDKNFNSEFHSGNEETHVQSRCPVLHSRPVGGRWGHLPLHEQSCGGRYRTEVRSAWRPRPESNRNYRFRKPVLYPFELRGRRFSLSRALQSSKAHSKIRRQRASLPQRERHIHPARLRLRVFAAAGGDDYVLAAIHFVGDRRGVAGERERRLPQQLAGGFIEGAEFFVEVGGSDKEQAAGGDDGAAVVVACRCSSIPGRRVRDTRPAESSTRIRRYSG